MKIIDLQKLNVALVYDKINTEYGGAEVVIQSLYNIFPKSTLFTSVYDPQVANWANKFEIKTSFLQKIPFFRKRHQLLAPLMPIAFETHDLSGFDLIISITAGEAKGVITKPGQLHICYLLTPTRYLHSHQKEYLNGNIFLRTKLGKILIQPIINYLTAWDLVAAHRPDYIIPISNLVKERVKRYYKRKNILDVIYPPVAIAKNEKMITNLPKLKTKNNYYLNVSRLVSYKRIDLSIKACLKLNRTLVIVGEGEAEKKLHTIAGESGIIKNEYETLPELFNRASATNKNIIFTKKLSQEKALTLMKNCQALLMPGIEDFGITALEAGIFGKPVVLFYKSGVAEILNKNHAVFIKKANTLEVIKAIEEIEAKHFDKHNIINNATKAGIKQFERNLCRTLSTLLQ
jgi:glycosyltransferase involved in cell wall biosynthesis